MQRHVGREGGRVTTGADAILLLSGGLDSTTVLALLARHQQRVIALTFDYGQLLSGEIAYAVDNARRWGAHHRVVTLDLRAVAPESALLNGGRNLPLDRTVAEIDAGGTPPSYVPFRNGIFLAYAVAFGEARGITDIYCGGNGLASGNYYDDTEQFAGAFQQAADEGTSPTYHPKIRFPLCRVSKAAVVQFATRLHVNLDDTWSCYRNLSVACGRCDSCVERTAAIARAPTLLFTSLPDIP